ncbi:MAG: hypothetical protein ABF289_05355 [Clostridiales bacterium]
MIFIKIVNYDNKPYASAPVSIVSSELIKKHDPKSVNWDKKNVSSESKSLKSANVAFSEIHDEIDPFNGETDLEILSRYKSIGLSRVEFQIFLAIFDIFNKEYNKTKTLELPVFLTLKDFHSKILCINNRIRKNDIEKYINIFDKLSNKLITIDTSKIINKKRKKVFIHGPIANITVISIPEDNFYGLKIFPTGYIQYECINIRHISNYLPRKFIQLDLRANDNILFFGYYLVRMHKLNRNENYTISNWKSSLLKAINNALPDPKSFIENYKNNKNQKSQYLNRHIILPIKKALEILKLQNYILKYDFVNLNTKNIFDESQKLNITFNYYKKEFLK